MIAFPIYKYGKNDIRYDRIIIRNTIVCIVLSKEANNKRTIVHIAEDNKMKPTVNTVFVDFGDVLRHYRIKEGLSQEQLADSVCSREYIGLIEKSKKIPTLYMIDAFSKKMGINLFDAYALIVEHNDFDTHQKIEQLNEAINNEDDDLLFQLANEYSVLPGFSKGVPFQCIMHAYSLYYSNVVHDQEKAIYFASEGLNVSGLSSLDQPPFSSLSNLDMCLLTAKAVALCRGGHYPEGRKTLEFLHECTKLRLEENRYIVNRNRRFDINMFAMTTYNICEFFPYGLENNLHLLDNSIRLLDKYGCSNKQSELLLYKARYLYDLGNIPSACHCFNAGYYLLVYRKSEDEADACARSILEERYDLLKNQT